MFRPIHKEMSYHLFLDDARDPQDVKWLELPPYHWVVVRSFKEFVNTISLLNQFRLYREQTSRNHQVELYYAQRQMVRFYMKTVLRKLIAKKI